MSWRKKQTDRLAAMSELAPLPEGVRISRDPVTWWDEATNVTPEMIDRVLGASKPKKS